MGISSTTTFGGAERPRLDAWLSGARAASPLLLGVVPFGLVYGVAAVAAGVTPLVAALMSLTVFAGASQMAVLQFVAEHSLLLPALLAGLAINLRMLLYSASIAPHFTGRSLLRKSVLAYFLTDQAYVIGMAGFGQGCPETRKAWYYLGAGTLVWGGFQVGGVVGAFLGASLPQSLQLGYAVPLTFLALLAPHLHDGYGRTVAIAAGCGALAFRALPWNCGVLAAIGLGIAAGCLMEWRGAKSDRNTKEVRR